MAKGYWIAFYYSVSDADALARYAKAATPVLAAGGARFLARGVASATYEGGDNQRCVVIEFPSVDHARRVYESADYARAAAELHDGAVKREIRIVEGVD